MQHKDKLMKQKSRNKGKPSLPADTKFFTKKMLAAIPVESEMLYRVKWTTSWCQHRWDYEDFKTMEEAESKFVEVGQNYYYVDLIEVAKTEKVVKKIYGSHV